MKEGWVKKSEEPPYGHAEESTLKDFSQKTGYELKQMLKVLSEHDIIASESQTLEEIAAKQGKTPGYIFGLITSSLGDNRTENQITGLGRKSFEQIAKELKMDSEHFLKELESMGIKAEKKDKFKSTVENQGFNAREVVDGFSNRSLNQK